MSAKSNFSLSPSIPASFTTSLGKGARSAPSSDVAKLKSHPDSSGLREVFLIFLIKPSHYDDDGYVIQWYRSEIPSNTMAVLNGILLDCNERLVLGDAVDIEVESADETNTRIRPKDMIRAIEQNSPDHRRGREVRQDIDADDDIDGGVCIRQFRGVAHLEPFCIRECFASKIDIVR